MTRFTRRRFLQASAGLAAAAGCGRKRDAGGKPFAGQELRVFVYAGGHERTMRAVFVPRFEEQTGATAVLDPGWWGSVVKLKASPPGDPPFDLVITDATEGYPAIKEGLFAQLDLSHVPNHKNLAAPALDNWTFRDRYAVPYPDAVMTLAYRRDLVPHAPAAWGDLLGEGVRGKVALYNSFYMSLYTFACMKVSKEGKAGTAADFIRKDLQGALRFAREHRGRVKFWWPTTTDMVLGLTRGDCAAGNMQSPEMLQALAAEKSLAAVVPADDRAFVQVMWCVPADSPRQALAERAIDLIFSEEMQLAFARRGMASAVLSVARQRAAEDAVWKALYPHTEAQLRAIRYYPYDTYAEHWNDISSFWDREVLRKG
jgi:putative spermidine/putrescine transport system substrate-binding protein